MMSKAHTHVCPCIFLITALCIVGCGGSSDVNQSTSNDEITAFLEENPEFADPGPQSESAPLGLEQ
jgi:hypothetical protein